MFESPTSEAEAVTAAVPLSNADLAAFRSSLRTFDASLADPDRLTRIRLLEQAKAAVAAAQAVEVAAFVRSRQAAVRAEIAATAKPGVGTRRRVVEAERAIGAEVGVARCESPAQASRFIGYALRAATELPQAFGLLAAGRVSERRVLSLHQATAWLSPEHRVAADAEIAPDLPGLGDRQVLSRATAAAARLDPAGACARIAAAENERRVSARPAPESMVWLTALLPMTDGVAAWAALDRAARTAKANGDPRSRGQVMADALVELVAGRAVADGVAVELELVMTDAALAGESDEPARVVGHGVLPAPRARELFLRDATGSQDPAARSIRRLFTDPAGRLVAMESTARLFAAAMRRFIRVRDDVCRTPWCDAPIRHTDHVNPAADGGPTRVDSGRGYCERCNYIAQADGMTSVVNPRDGTVVTRTPTGQLYRSREPTLPRERPLHRAPVIDLVWKPQRNHAA